MGVVSTGGDLSFSSRARVKFTLAGTTDGGLEFGGSFRAHQADGAAEGTNGSVFIKGGFGTLTMGDIDSAAQNAVGQIAGVGYTGLGTLNEIAYVSSGDDEGLLYEYSASGFTAYLSAGQPDNGDDTASVGVKYATDTFTVGLGADTGSGSDQYAASVAATVAGASLTALYSSTESAGVTTTAAGLSAAYTMGTTTITAFGLDNGDSQNLGLGASYDLGGGASLVGGLVRGDSTDNDVNADLGVTFSF